MKTYYDKELVVPKINVECLRENILQQISQNGFVPYATLHEQGKFFLPSGDSNAYLSKVISYNLMRLSQSRERDYTDLYKFLFNDPHSGTNGIAIERSYDIKPNQYEVLKFVFEDRLQNSVLFVLEDSYLNVGRHNTYELQIDKINRESIKAVITPDFLSAEVKTIFVNTEIISVPMKKINLMPSKHVANHIYLHQLASLKKYIDRVYPTLQLDETLYNYPVTLLEMVKFELEGPDFQSGLHPYLKRQEQKEGSSYQFGLRLVRLPNQLDVEILFNNNQNAIEQLYGKKATTTKDAYSFMQTFSKQFLRFINSTPEDDVQFSREICNSSQLPPGWLI